MYARTIFKFIKKYDVRLWTKFKLVNDNLAAESCKHYNTILDNIKCI
jgi:hypothetical protein